ncbi:MAG: DUF4417 domain-containing protein [Kiritimatiellae bacterium]|nr:DUF4417 domain-containing protein [Kiritimatiellia bacterium]
MPTRRTILDDISARFRGLVSPDCSLYRDTPLCLQIANTYRNRADGGEGKCYAKDSRNGGVRCPATAAKAPRDSREGLTRSRQRRRQRGSQKTFPEIIHGINYSKSGAASHNAATPHGRGDVPQSAVSPRSARQLRHGMSAWQVQHRPAKDRHCSRTCCFRCGGRHRRRLRTCLAAIRPRRGRRVP